MFWNLISDALSPTGVKDVSVWQDVLISTILIPISIFIFKKIGDWWFNTRPLQLLLKGYLSDKIQILIFLSQLVALNDSRRIDRDPRYIIRYPTPTPTNRNAISGTPRRNIDPVWSEGDGECLADIYNILGKAGRIGNIEVSDLVSDWSQWSNPIFSIGFNPKTMRNLARRCKPIYYEITPRATLKIEGHGIELDSIVPNDAAIVQKTFIEDTNIPVFILAGHGYLGTSSAGYFLRENCIDIGKLYGDRAFCLLLYVNISEGRKSVVLKATYPKPTPDRIILYPFTFFKYRKKSVFPKAN